MNWKKLGLIFSVENNHSWMRSHAAVPFAEKIEGDLYRVYFTTRDSQSRSHTGFIEIDIKSSKEILKVSDKPVLAPGNLGEFDDSGAMGSWLVQHGTKTYLYYQGWNLGTTVPFRNSIGLSVSENGTFSRFSPGPILDRSMFEPHFTATPCVLIDNGIWKMWYLSCTEWRIVEGRPQHRYHIKYAESSDGIHWDRRGKVAIDYSDELEYAISRPSVIKDGNTWRMWYSYRGDRYRIGYAESADGISWVRKDREVGIGTSNSGWDSEMVEYPFVFDHDGSRYMLYNGNDYGRSGFGLAVLEN